MRISLIGLIAALCTIGLPAQDNPRCSELARLTLQSVSITEVTRSEKPVPACVVRGQIDRRTGIDGRTFYIGFELRLPDSWERRFLFSGGGGMDGIVRPATKGLDRGFAVVTTDAGHQADPASREADPSFGVDQQARIDLGWRSIDRVTEVARTIVATYYSTPAKYSYLDGCSNGGRQGLIAAQRFPLLFDGIVAGAPAFRVTRAAIGSAWETNALTAIAPRDDAGQPILSRAFSDSDLKLIGKAVLKACDNKDGAEDGLVFNVGACRSFDPSPLVCSGSKTASCLSPEQVATFKKIMGGPVNSKGESIYSDWPYDPGIAAPGWRALKLGTSQAASPNSQDVLLMLAALKSVFLLPIDPRMDISKFDYDKDTERTREASQEIDATAAMLSSFSQKGKLLLYHGMADPFFSAWDTVRYMERLQQENGGPENVSQWARLFLVPGMNHCFGGPSLSQFDALGAMVSWVEQRQAPDRINATGISFPGVSRPLCVYPKYARYGGVGPLNDASSFTCSEPH